MVILFLVSGVVGNAFSVCFADPFSPSMGASTAIFGLFGGMVGFLLLNWHKLPQESRGYLACIVGFIVIMNFMFGAGNSRKGGSSDMLAHVGGLMAGVCLGMVVCDMPDQISTAPVWEKRVKMIGLILIVTYSVLSIMGIWVFVKEIEAKQTIGK